MNTDIPEWAMKDALEAHAKGADLDGLHNIARGIRDGGWPVAREAHRATAIAIMVARDKALEDVAAVAYDKIEDCEHADAAAEWYKGYASACRGLAESILAMKSNKEPKP